MENISKECMDVIRRLDENRDRLYDLWKEFIKKYGRDVIYDDGRGFFPVINSRFLDSMSKEDKQEFRRLRDERYEALMDILRKCANEE